MQWSLKALKQYADFNGRARRTEFWMFTLVNAIVSIVLSVIDELLGTTSLSGAESGTVVSGGLLGSLYTLAVLIPMLAVGARRLHDTGRSGWWQLLGLIPLVGAIILIVWWASDGRPGANEYGMNPKLELYGADQPLGPPRPDHQPPPA